MAPESISSVNRWVGTLVLTAFVSSNSAASILLQYLYAVPAEDGETFEQQLKTHIAFSNDLTAETFALLTGLGYCIPFVCASLLWGFAIVPGYRKYVLGLGALLWSLSTAGMIFTTNYTQMLQMRIFMAVGQASNMPVSFSILTDMFSGDRERLGTANGIMLSGMNLGQGICVFAIPLALKVGWKMTACLYALPGIALLFLLPLVPDVERSDKDDRAKTTGPADLKASIAALMGSRMFICSIVAGALRFGAGFITLGFFPRYFARLFPEHVEEYVLVEFVAKVFGCSFSLLAGGVASDYWAGARNVMRLDIAIFTTFCSLILMPFLFAGSGFYTTMFLLCLYYCFSEALNAPLTTLYQNDLDQEFHAFAGGVFQASCCICGAIVLFIFAKWIEADDLAGLDWGTKMQRTLQVMTVMCCATCVIGSRQRGFVVFNTTQPLNGREGGLFPVASAPGGMARSLSHVFGF